MRVLQTWYPLRSLPGQRQIWSWTSFDVANQSFTLIINTLLFSIFFSKVVVRDPSRESQLWAVTYASSMLLVVLASPICGAISDARACKKLFLLGTGFGCAALTCALAFIRPGQLWLAMLLYIPANFLFNIGENFLAAFLPGLAPRKDVGRVSGFSWACAYTSALFLLVVTAGLMMLFQWKDPNSWRPLFVMAGVWFFLFSVPTLLILKEPPAPVSTARVNVFKEGFVRLLESARKTARFRDLAMLLVASLFYGTGMNVIIFFASLLASEFGFSDVQLVVFVAVITVSGVIGTLIPTLVQDRFGHKRTTLALLVLWLATAIAFAVFAYSHTNARWPLWVLGNFVGLGLGSLGSANRAFVGFLAPANRSGEVFGLWGLVFKFAAVLTIPFAIVKDRVGTAPALLVLAGFVAVGFVLTLFVNEQRGSAAARDAAA